MRSQFINKNLTFSSIFNSPLLKKLSLFGCAVLAGQQVPTATRGRPRTQTCLSRTREVEVRDAAVDNRTRFSGMLAPDEWATPVAPLWETEAANDTCRQWEDSIEERMQQSNNLLQQMHQMISDKFAGDNLDPRIDNLMNDDVPPFFTCPM